MSLLSQWYHARPDNISMLMLGTMHRNVCSCSQSISKSLNILQMAPVDNVDGHSYTQCFVLFIGGATHAGSYGGSHGASSSPRSKCAVSHWMDLYQSVCCLQGISRLWGGGDPHHKVWHAVCTHEDSPSYCCNLFVAETVSFTITLWALHCLGLMLTYTGNNHGHVSSFPSHPCNGTDTYQNHKEVCELWQPDWCICSGCR